MSDENAARERGYRYYKQLEAQRRGYAFIRDTIAEFLINRRWQLGQREQVQAVVLELVDKLMEAGALALYQCGIDVENNQAIKEQEQRRQRQLRQAETSSAVHEAREDERLRVDRRIAELNEEREREKYEDYLRRELARANEKAANEAARGIDGGIISESSAEIARAEIAPVVARSGRARRGTKQIVAARRANRLSDGGD